MALRIGSALDVHGFSAEGPLKLGLVEIENAPRLAGHSDGDAVAHAIADAMLLAAGLPDLGGCIGVGEPEWKGATGAQILEHIAALVKAAGFEPESISAQIVAKRPRLLEHLPLMRAQLTDLLGAPVNVSATTTDGFIPDLGSGEALACLATALLRPVQS